MGQKWDKDLYCISDKQKAFRATNANKPVFSLTRNGQNDDAIISKCTIT
jgi:hypothetical protein